MLYAVGGRRPGTFRGSNLYRLGARMRGAFLRRSQRGGVVLDLVLAAGLILIGAFTLSLIGITFHELLRGAGHFFGV